MRTPAHTTQACTARRPGPLPPRAAAKRAAPRPSFPRPPRELAPHLDARLVGPRQGVAAPHGGLDRALALREHMVAAPQPALFRGGGPRRVVVQCERARGERTAVGRRPAARGDMGNPGIFEATLPSSSQMHREAAAGSTPL